MITYALHTSYYCIIASVSSTVGHFYLIKKKSFKIFLHKERRGGLTFRYFLLTEKKHFHGWDLTDKDGTTLKDYLQWRIVSVLFLIPNQMFHRLTINNPNLSIICCLKELIMRDWCRDGTEM